MDLGIKNRTALVAASSQGLGKAAALALAKEGVNLAICSRNKSKIEAAADEIRETTGVKVVSYVADVSQALEIDRLVESALSEFGKIDILVNNAGGPPTGNIASLPDSDWEWGFNVTLMSMVRMTRAVLPTMQRHQWGRVISIVSLTAKQPIDDLMISSTIRPGILGLTKILANENGKFNITINSVCPGYILTKRQEELSLSRSAEKKMTLEEYLSDSAKNIPIGRLGRPDELGDVIAFLASERASYINGSNIIVDGGQVKNI